jgi:hypothetical protein
MAVHVRAQVIATGVVVMWATLLKPRVAHIFLRFHGIQHVVDVV